MTFLARWPADKAMQHARDRIRELTRRSQAAAAGEVDRGGPEPVPARLGRLLPVRRLRGPLREDQELRADAAGAVHQQAPPPLPGVRLVGRSPSSPRTSSAWSPCRESSSTPGPSGTGGKGRMPAVNGVGEPCAGEPHARFEAAGAGNGADLARNTGVKRPAGKPAEHGGRTYSQRSPPRQPPTLHTGRAAERRA